MGERSGSGAEQRTTENVGSDAADEDGEGWEDGENTDSEGGEDEGEDGEESEDCDDEDGSDDDYFE